MASQPKTDEFSPLTPLERTLRDSLLPAEFRDVHLYAFSRRTIRSDSTIRIDHPLPVVAVGSMLKETDYFSKLLTSGFAETNPRSTGGIRQCAFESEYDYDTDSDLDEFEEPEDTHTPVAGPPSASSSKGKGKAKGVDAEMDSSGDCEGTVPNVNVERGAKHHEILLPNVAYRTLRACVFYLYTRKINFLPLTSQGQTDRRFTLLTTSDILAPPCSPKSIYRLAEAYGITELQQLAFDKIISQLTPKNIVEEAFNSFFARYDRLREHAVSLLSQHYSSPEVQESLSDVLCQIVSGELPHTGGMLRSLLGLRVATTSVSISHTPSVSKSSTLATTASSEPKQSLRTTIPLRPPSPVPWPGPLLSQQRLFAQSTPPLKPRPTVFASNTWGFKKVDREATSNDEEDEPELVDKKKDSPSVGSAAVVKGKKKNEKKH